MAKDCSPRPPGSEDIPAQSHRYTKRRGEIGEVEAFCGRERSGSPQPKSRAQRGTSPPRRDTKRRGEIGEAAFLAKASSMGWGVAKPWGDSDRYDLIVDVCGRLLKVQVKSAHRVCAQPGGGYHIRAHPHQRVSYRDDEIDFLVAYIVPEDIWYVFPPSAFQNDEIPAPVSSSQAQDLQIRAVPRSLGSVLRGEIT